MSSVVFDASALLAVLNHEPGEALVRAAIRDGAAMSTVNLSEVVARLNERSLDEVEVRDALAPYTLELLEFDEPAALAAGLLRLATRRQGLSLGDRACVALASSLGLPVITADRRWTNLDPALGVEVQLIR